MNQAIPGRRPIPGYIRSAVLERAEHCCEDCGAGVRLEMHHLTYIRTPFYKYEESIFGYERPEDLAALCRSCHLQRHLDENGEFWADPEALAEERSYREHMERDDYR